jgi:hypothetical protein
MASALRLVQRSGSEMKGQQITLIQINQINQAWAKGGLQRDIHLTRAHLEH